MTTAILRSSVKPGAWWTPSSDTRFPPEEFEDPDGIHIGEDYYLAGTARYMNPALIVPHSRNLVNRELSSYCMDRLDLGPAHHQSGMVDAPPGEWWNIIMQDQSSLGRMVALGPITWDNNREEIHDKHEIVLCDDPCPGLFSGPHA
jgi:beta-xylosidase